MENKKKKEEILKSAVVTIDGPAGSGKSTTASLLAERLGLTYLDTGAMYRAVTFAVIKEGIDPDNGVEVSNAARSIDLEVRTISGKPAVYLNGTNVEKDIRDPAVSSAVSPVSRHAGVREEMVRLQRKMGRGGGIVAEGRDTGSVVFPYAHVKIFLVADIDARSARRLDQLQMIGIKEKIEDIRSNILNRDSIDSNRENSPLVRPPGSILVDTSNLTIDEQVSIIESHVKKEVERLAELRVGRGDRNPFTGMQRYYRVSHFLVRNFFRLFFGLRFHGQENLRFRENFILASNHISYLDPLVAGCALNREVSFIAKKELFRNRLFAWLIRTYNAIPVDRDEINRKTLKMIIDKLKRGESILMFPEGTRSRNGNLGSFKGGLGFICLNTGVSVVPVFITGTDAPFECILRKKRMEVRIGPPIRLSKEYIVEDKKKDYQVLSTMVLEELRMLKDEAQA